ncbi:MAG: CRTAC1 family protein [Candidatus Sumerlaeia bacterium]|nr:CRTAC1 family protein [Candidatus Sumerlaeia bacterium]
MDLIVWNDDGADDLLYRNDGTGHFEEIAAAANVQGSTSYSEAPGAVFDADNDGLPDFYVPCSFLEAGAKNRFHRNLDGFHFEEMSIPLGLRTSQLWARGPTAVDVNQDGLLDLFTGSLDENPFTLRTFLYMSRWPQPYVDESSARGLDYALNDFAHLWFDWGDDGDLDLFVGTFVSGFGVSAEEIDRIYENDGTGHFTWASGAINSSPLATTGVYLADFDGNGTLDILALQTVRPNATNPPPVLNNVWNDNGDGTFTDIAPALNLGMPESLVADARTEKRMAVVADFDNDMDPDVYVATWNAVIGGEPRDELWLNEGGVYVERGVQAGITLGLNTYACAAADVNGDGFLDIYAVNDNDFGTRDTLYLNNGNSNHWLEIDPRGIISNRDAIGLKAWLTAGGVAQVQELYSTTTLPSLLHFGLGPNTTVEQLVLRWPRGLVETYTGLSADQVFRPVEGAATPFDGTGLLLR